MIESPPNFEFGAWQKWAKRDRPSQDFDVPRDFGFYGLYLLSTGELDSSPAETDPNRHLQAHVLYIGKSTQVEQRLERSHKAVANYRERFEDKQFSRLWFSTWHSGWNSGEHDASRKAINLASMAFYERAAILEYVRTHGRLPILNRE